MKCKKTTFIKCKVRGLGSRLARGAVSDAVAGGSYRGAQKGDSIEL